MDPVSGVVVYIMIWWVLFFMALPIGAQSAHEAGENTEVGNTSSAPLKHNLKKKIIYVSFLSALLWFGAYGLIRAEIVNFYDMAYEMMEQDI